MEAHEVHEKVEQAAHAGGPKGAAPGKGRPPAKTPPLPSHPPASHPPASHPPASHPPASHPPASHPPASHTAGVHSHGSHDDEHGHGDGDGDGGHGHGGHGDGVNGRRVAILISVLAALLALVETGAKSSQNEQMSASIEANDLWSFYQGKTVRMSVARAFADYVEATDAGTLLPEQQEKLVRLTNEWRANIQRYESEPHTGEGRKELQARAIQAQARRDLAQNRLHNFEYGAAALQLAVVLASASVVTNALWLTASSMALGGVGAGLGLLGVFAPELMHHLLHRTSSGGH